LIVIRANSTITFAVSGTTAGLIPTNALSVRTTVADRLSLYFDMLALTITPPSWMATVLNVEWLHWSYTASVTVKTRIDHGDIDDVRSVVANAFYIATGAMPTVSVPGAGEIQQNAPVDYPGTGIDLGAPLEKLGEWFQNTEMILVLGVLGIVALIMFSPAGKAGARSLGNVRFL